VVFTSGGGEGWWHVMVIKQTSGGQPGYTATNTQQPSVSFSAHAHEKAFFSTLHQPEREREKERERERERERLHLLCACLYCDSLFCGTWFSFLIKWKHHGVHKTTGPNHRKKTHFGIPVVNLIHVFPHHLLIVTGRSTFVCRGSLG